MTRATTSKSNGTAYWIETSPCTAMPQSKPTYHPEVMGTIYKCHPELPLSKLGLGVE